MELHSLWTFYYETVLNSQILLANPLWNGFVHCDLQCAFWNWSKYTSAGRKRFATALPLHVTAHYITRPQDTSIHSKNFTDTTIQMKLPLWNRSRVSLWVSEENSKMQLHCNKFIITGYLVGGSTPLLCLEGVPDLRFAPRDEAGLTKTFQTWPRGWFHIP